MDPSTKRRVAIITDSTSDLPRELVEQYGIHVIPQILIMGDKTWRDGVDIDPPTFYELLRTSPSFPSTSQPSVADFQALFQRLATESDGILAILISNELSGTLNAAQNAKASLPDLPVPVEIIDSRSVSLQLGLIVLAAARAAASGAELHTVASLARSMVNQVKVYFIVDTLEYLHRGGRIGAAKRLFGTALNLKPVMEIRDGVVTPVANIRTRRKALDKVLEVCDQELAGKERIRMAVLHVAAPEEAAQLKQELAARYKPMELITAPCGPVVGAHAGPGTAGVVYYVEPA
jgi:DegV family protein with EDD domain